MSPDLSLERPPHPGTVLHQEFLAGGRLTVNGLAGRLGLTPSEFDRLLAGQYRVRRALAARLAELTDTAAEYWVALQEQWEDWGLPPRAARTGDRVAARV